LCSKVLSARYLKEERSILTAVCPKSGSYTWKSILHGRDLLREGLVWRIGNGSAVKVWEDNWIPRTGLMRPYGQISGSESVSKVEDLLLPDGQGWNEAKLRAVFFRRTLTISREFP
jgi:hypothetical protein